MVDLTLIKSRTNKAGQSATLVFNQDTGFDPELSLFILLKDNGRINGAGIGMYLRDNKDIKFSQKNFKDKLRENPELQEMFMEEVIDVLKTQLENDMTKSLDSDRYESTNISNRILDRLNAI